MTWRTDPAPEARPGGRPRGGTLAASVTGGAWTLVVVLLLSAPALQAQDYRGWTRSTFRYIEARPVGLDTIPRSRVSEGLGQALLYRGRAVQCIDDARCLVYVPLAVEGSALLTQDAGITAWGLGVRGLSAHAEVRARARLGGDFLWPRSRDELDVLMAYGQWIRGGLRLRAGRLRNLSGLGFTSYDGGSVLFGRGGMALEAYGGRSLARGLSEPRNEILRGVDDFVRDEGAYLVGAHVRLEPLAGTSLDVRYQREIWADRAGLISERGSLDLRSDFLGPVRVDGSLDYDVAFRRFGKGHLTVHLPLAEGRLGLEGTVRRYRPYFELSTIWGFFSPTDYAEIEGRVRWSPRSDLSLWATGGYRSYGDVSQAILGEPLEDDGRRVGAGAAWRDDRWSARGSYGLEWGPGSFLSSGEADLRWSSGGRLTLGIRASAFQRIEEFRVGEGMVVGGGGLFGVELPGRTRMDGGVSVYRHVLDGRLDGSDWSQLRIWSGLRVDLGDDPGRRGRLRR